MTFANKITLFRIVSIPFFIVAFAFYAPGRPLLKATGLGIFLLAVISDAVDGMIARMHRQKTPAGALLDPLADKALLIAAFLVLYRVSKTQLAVPLPAWVVILVVSRDVMLLIGGGLILILKRVSHIAPTLWGKAATFFQMATIIGLILEMPVVRYVWTVTCVLTVLSGIDYVRRGIHILNETQPALKT